MRASAEVMMQMSTAGGLLGQLYNDSDCLADAVATAAGIQVERARGAVTGGTRLTLSEQLRLSEAMMQLAPAFTRQAMRLRAQVLAARGLDDRAVLLQQDAPGDRREQLASAR